jgi:hypothetical protein
MATIHNNDTVIGHKESLESKRAFYAGKKANSIYKLARIFMNDTTFPSTNDSIKQILQDINTLTSSYLQAFCSFNKTDSLGVVNKLNDISNDFDLNYAEIDYNNYFKDYCGILLKLQLENRNALRMDTLEKSEIHTIMDNTGGLLHAYARNALILNDGLIYQEPYLQIDTTTKTDKVKYNTNSVKTDFMNYLKIYPNPAIEYLSIEYDIDYLIGEAAVEIFDISGNKSSKIDLYYKKGIKTVDLRNYKRGSYIVKLRVGNKILETKKFIKL